MSATPSQPVTLYDIATRLPREETCCAPNPWKARYALNFKGIPFTTEWVYMPEISKVRKELGVPPCRKFADGKDFYTLPIVVDPNTGEKIGDSFDIAIYLQKTYPESGAGDLFPEQSLEFTYDNNILVPLSEVKEGTPHMEYANFNANVDAAFSNHVILTVGGYPYDPVVEKVSKDIFAERAGIKFEQFILPPEARRQVMTSFEKMLGPEGLGKLYLRDPSGPFITGSKASHADLIVGGWLKMCKVCLPTEEWEEVKGWHDGLFGKLYDALEVFAKA